MSYLRFPLTAFAMVALLAGVPAADSHAQARTKIEYALGDVISIDELPLLVAAERAKKRGVDVEITSFKSEEVATQAVINGQADIGQGTPYAAVQKVNVPIRFFYQMSALQFFPIVNKDSYTSWKDLNGQEVVVHARGSGTEAIMRLMAKEHGIEYKSISFVPGSDVRALGLLKGTIKASILDATNKNYVMKEAPGKFVVLPLGKVKASDEALFATRAFLEKNEAAVAVLVEELITCHPRDQRQSEVHPGRAQEARAAEGPAGQARGGDPALLRGRREERHLPRRRRWRECGAERSRLLQALGQPQGRQPESRTISGTWRRLKAALGKVK